MILDIALALNALIWCVVLILPFYGFWMGYKDRRPLMLRAQLILLCLVVLLLAMEFSLATVAAAERAQTLERLISYRTWLFIGVAGASALGWGNFAVARRMAS